MFPVARDGWPPPAARRWSLRVDGRDEARSRPGEGGRPRRDGLDRLGDQVRRRVVDHVPRPRHQPQLAARDLLAEPDRVPADVHDLVLGPRTITTGRRSPR